METAKVFTNGRSQAVRIPKEFRFDTEEVYINRIGNALILTPISSLAEEFDRGAALLTADFLADGLPESIDSYREDL